MYTFCLFTSGLFTSDMFTSGLFTSYLYLLYVDLQLHVSVSCNSLVHDPGLKVLLRKKILFLGTGSSLTLTSGALYLSINFELDL